MIRLALRRRCFARLRTWRAVSAGRPTVWRTTLFETGMTPLYTRMVKHVPPRLEKWLVEAGVLFPHFKAPRAQGAHESKQIRRRWRFRTRPAGAPANTAPWRTDFFAAKCRPRRRPK